MFTIVVLLFTDTASAQTPAAYTATDLGTAGGLFTSSAATGINNRGEVVGYTYYVINPPPGSTVATVQINRAFVYDGAMHDLGQEYVPGAAINERGEIASSLLGHADLAELNHDGSVSATPLVDPNSVWTLLWAADVNKSGQVAVNGYATHGVGLATHALVFDKGGVQDLGEGVAYGINARGEVVGCARNAFLYDGTLHDLGVLGVADHALYSHSSASAINDKGQVTGFSTTSTPGVSDAFLYDG